MPSFVPVGKFWLNVDSIQMVEVDETDRGETFCKVHFTGGDTVEMKGDEAKKLIELVKKSKAG